MKWKKYFIRYCCGIVIFVILLCLVFLIPNDKLNSNIEQIRVYINLYNGDSPNIMFDASTVLDTYTDVHMYNALLRESDNVLIAAMDVNHYARYWHGYLVVLRPLTLFFDYDEIRYICGLVLMVLFAGSVSAITNRIGKLAGVTYALSLALTMFALSILCLQYVNVYLLLFAAILLLAKKYRVDQPAYAVLLLFEIGMLTNFFDFLTYPVIIPGGVSIFLILIHMKEDKSYSMAQGFKLLFSVTAAWGIGYAVTWVTKWLLATIVLQRNIFAEAAEQVIYRSYGNGFGKTGQIIVACKRNVSAMFMERPGKIMAAGLVLCIVFCLIRECTLPKSDRRKTLPLLIVGVYPYIWYAVLVQHSNQHNYFTWRAQMLLLWVLSYVGAQGAIYCSRVVKTRRKNGCKTR